MPNLPEEYIVLFNAITEAEEALRRLGDQLAKAQLLAEEIYISRENAASSKPDQGAAMGG